MGKIYTIKFQRSFQDGNVFNRIIQKGEQFEVPAEVVNKVRQSDPMALEFSRMYIPPSNIVREPVKEADVAPTAPSLPAKEIKGLKATPQARLLAKQCDISLALVEGTGKGGYITKADVENYHASK